MFEGRRLQGKLGATIHDVLAAGSFPAQPAIAQSSLRGLFSRNRNGLIAARSLIVMDAGHLHIQ
mgnify:CR=1 FL=1